VAARDQPVAADAKQHALTLVKRVAGQLKPDPKLPFAIETTIRQLDRYCIGGPRQTASFPAPPATFRSPQPSSAKRCELHGWNESAGIGGAHAAFSDHAGSGMIGLAGFDRSPTRLVAAVFVS
jgi:hypothetical protein